MASTVEPLPAGPVKFGVLAKGTVLATTGVTTGGGGGGGGGFVGVQAVATRAIAAAPRQ